MLTRRTLLFATLALVPSGAFAAPFELEPGITVLEPLSHGALSVYPLVQTERAAVPSGKYLSLKQGVATGVVTVSEMPNGGDVNRLRVKNTSAQPLLLLSGEIVLGGKQDRVTSTDTVVEANSARVVSVFCVEHGRWNGQAAFAGTGGFAEGKLRRLARYEKDQSGVWNHVAKKTAALKASSSTGTYRAVATGKQGEEAMKPYREHIGAQMRAHPQAKSMVGLMTAVNGNILSIDVFDDPGMFSEYRAQLLDAAYLDASALDLKPTTKPVAQAVKELVSENEAALPVQTSQSATSQTETKNSLNAIGTGVTAGKRKLYRSYQSKNY